MPRRTFRRATKKYSRPIRGAAKRRYLRGRGDFKSFIKSAWGGLKKAGKAAWGVARAPIMGAVVPAATAALRTITGVGDYSATSRGRTNSSMKYMAAVPVMHGPSGLGSFRLKHTERCNVQTPRDNALNLAPGIWGSTAFSVLIEALGLNPGNAVLFPWLSSIAKQFTHYRFSGLAFEYRTTSGEQIVNSGVPQIGRVLLATELDCYRPTPQHAGQLETMQYVNFGKPSVNFLHGIECSQKLMQAKMYSITSDPNPGQRAHGDSRLDYYGKLMIATEGIVQNGNDRNKVGDLYVTYDVELLRPTVPDIANLEQAQLYGSGDQTFEYASLGREACSQAPDPVCPFGRYTKYSPPPVEVNTIGIKELYGENIAPGNDGGLLLTAQNGWQFPQVDDGQRVFRVDLNWYGDSAGAATDTSFNNLVTTGKLHFVKGTFLNGTTSYGLADAAAWSSLSFYVLLNPGPTDVPSCLLVTSEGSVVVKYKNLDVRFSEVEPTALDISVTLDALSF